MKWIPIFIFLTSCGPAIDQPEPLMNRYSNDAVAGGVSTQSFSSDSLAADPNKPYATAIINEILYDVPGSDTGGELFIELRVLTDGYLDGFQLIFVNGDDGLIKGSILLDGEFSVSESDLFIIADAVSSESVDTHVSHANYVANFDPQNGPDSVQLLNQLGELIDVVAYGEVAADMGENGFATFESTPGPRAPSGQSISRLNEGSDTDNNMIDFVVNKTPSPGKFEVTVE